VRAVRDVLDATVERGWPADVGNRARVPTMARADWHGFVGGRKPRVS
jgi:hypothetical protein